MYQVIARKWRPQTFEEVTGQEHITRTLRNAIEHERVAYAYLFSGARGVGKTTTARLLAKALNCHKSDRPTARPCALTDPDPCVSCVEIAEGRSIDVLEIDAASNTGVDNVRAAVLGNVAVRPARDRYKVFIIDEVHMLSGAAFNALLKTLEEPPPRVVFIMATTESHKVPDTILSRCQQFEFRTIAATRIAERLRIIADTEGVDAADDALREIARAGEGSMRDAQSAFDQVISFSEGRITAAEVEAALGIAGAEMLERVTNAVAEEKPAEILRVVNDLVMRGHDLRNFCRDLLLHFRNLLVVKIVGPESSALEANDAEQRDLQRAGARFSESDLVRFFHALTETENSLRLSAQPRYQLEVGLIKLVEMRRLAPIGQVLERLEALERGMRNGSGGGGNVPSGNAAPPSSISGGAASSSGNSPSPAKRFDDSSQKDSGEVAAPAAAAAIAPPKVATETAPPAPPSAPPAQSSPPPVVAAAAAPPLKLVATPPPFDDAQFEEFADEDGELTDDFVAPASAGTIVEEIKAGLEANKKPFLVTALEGALSVKFDDGELVIRFGSAAKHLRDALTKPENIKMLRDVCRETIGRDVGVRITSGGGGGGDDDAGDGRMPRSADEEARREKQKLRELAEQHPTVRQLLKTFRGEIVDVRRIDPKQV